LIADRAEQSVITGCRVVGVNTTKYRIAGIIRTQVSVITDRRGSPNTGTTGTGISRGTGISVVAGVSVVGINTADSRIAGVIGTQVAVITVWRGSPNTGTGGTGVIGGTGISVVAGCRVVRV